MAVPQRKTSKARKLKRRAHHAMSEPARVRCSRCNDLTPPHTVCETCGHYRGKAILTVE